MLLPLLLPIHSLISLDFVKHLFMAKFSNDLRHEVVPCELLRPSFGPLTSPSLPDLIRSRGYDLYPSDEVTTN